MIWLSLISGYLIGSFLPAYFLTRAIVGIDIRTVGSFHAGTTNVFRTAGLVPAIITAVYDLSKGIIAIWLSILFGNPLWVGYLSGLCAVIGHIFPFYLQFRFKPDVRIWRVFIRPAAISLNYLALIMPRQDFLLLLGIVLLIFMSIDITRLMSNKANKFFHSSMKFKLYKEEHFYPVNKFAFIE